MAAGAMTGRRLEPLDDDTCRTLLRRGVIGRLAHVRDGLPQVVPLNYVLDEGEVVFRCDHGDLLDAIEGTPVAFEVDDVDLEYHTGWSVVVHGTAQEIWDPPALDRARELPLRPWAPGDRGRYVRIATASLTGRRIV
jgi:uncharacterized protein